MRLSINFPLCLEHFRQIDDLKETRWFRSTTYEQLCSVEQCYEPATREIGRFMETTELGIPIKPEQAKCRCSCNHS